MNPAPHRSEAELLRQTGRLARIGGWELDLATGRPIWSEELYRLHAIAPGTPLTLDLVFGFYTPEGRAAIEAAAARCLADGTPFDLELPFTTATGQRLWVRALGEPIRDQGRIVRLAGCLQDVTERRQGEARYRALFAAANVGIGISDAAGHLLEVNRAFADLLGYDPGELAGTHLSDLVHPEDRAADLDRLRAALADPASPANQVRQEQRYLHRDGRPVWCRVSASVVRDAGGAPWLNLVVVEDVSARRQSEEARDRLLAILDRAPDLISTATLDRRILYLNPAGRRLLGYAPDQDPGGRRFTDHLPDWAARLILEEAIPAAVREGAWAGETAFRTCAGTEVPMAQIILAHHDARGEVAYLSTIARDLTAARRLEEEQRAIEARLQEAQRLESLGVLAGGVAHDFNNLLTTILGYAGLAEADLPAGSPALAHLAALQQAAQRAAGLCQQMLAYSGRGRFVVAPVDLNAVVRDAALLLHGALPAGVHLDLDLAPDLPPLQADAAQLRQVVLSLLHNGAEAVGPGPGRVVVRTALVRLDRAALASLRAGGDRPPGPFALVEVHDTGCGMAPAVLARVFEPFFSTKFAGRGLGLAAVLGIVRGHGGAVGVESAPHAGSTFRIYFPVSLPDPAPTVEPAILVAAEDPPLRELTARILAAHGFRVERTAAASLLQSLGHRPEAHRLVVYELAPGRPGAEGDLAEVRRRFPGLPVLVLAAPGTCSARGPWAGVVTTPFTVADLVGPVRQALAG